MMADKKQFTYEYERPAVTTDCTIFGFDGKRLHVLLIQRGIEPFKGDWALPGGFLKNQESVEEGARRELEEETHVKDVYLKQFRVYSEKGRDPRGWTITVVFYALIRQSDCHIIAGDDAVRAKWFDLNELPKLAFDHATIIQEAHEHLKNELKISPIAFRLLDEEFTIGDLQRVYEAVNGRSYDRRNFHRKALASGYLKNKNEEEEEESTVGAKCVSSSKEKTPTQFFSFNEEEYLSTDENASKRNPFEF